MIRFIFLSALSLLAAGAQAQVYKCVDASGKTAYSQSPCPGSARSAPVARAAPPAPAAAPAAKGGDAGKAAKPSGPKSAAELEQEFRKRKQEQEDVRKKEEQKLAEAKDKEENCRSARQQLASIEAGMRQARINEKGERYFLDDGQIAQEKTSARKSIDQWCK